MLKIKEVRMMEEEAPFPLLDKDGNIPPINPPIMTESATSKGNMVILSNIEMKGASQRGR